VRRGLPGAGRGVLLLGLAAVIAKLLATGQMVKYMAPALDPLSALTAVVLLVMGAVELLGAARGGLTGGHATDGAWVEDALTYTLVLVILGVGLAVTPRALGSSGLGGERVAGLLLRFGPGSTGPASAAAPTPASPPEDLGPVLAYLREVGQAGLNHPARVVGTFARSDEFGPGEFALLRYAIAHCVADARPVALLVVASGDPDLEADQWVEVEGTLAVRERQGDRLVAIEARRIRRIEEPQNPYLSAVN